MDQSYRFKQYSHAQFNPPGGPGPGPNGPSPTTSSPHSATHPSPMLANFARGFAGNQSNLEKMMSSFGDGGPGGMGYAAGPSGSSGNNDHGHGHGSRSFSYGSNEFIGQGQGQGQGQGMQQQQQQGPGSAGQGQSSSAPAQQAAKRGSKACVACRKGKNRCENDPNTTNGVCKRCAANGIQCVFEKASDRSRTRNESVATEGFGGEAEGRVSHLENTVRSLASGQNQIQMALQQILSMLPQNNAFSNTPSSVPSFLSQQGDGGVNTANIFQTSVSPPDIFGNGSASNHSPHNMSMFPPPIPHSPQNTASGRRNDRPRQTVKHEQREFPKLPGFAPPAHRFGTYGIIPLSSAPPSPSRSRRSSVSSNGSTGSDSALPQDSLTAPIQALQALANAADQARDGEGEGENKSGGSDGENGDKPSKKRKRVTIDGKGLQLRVKKKTKPDPTPRNPFPDVVTKGLVDEVEARELWDIFFSGCHYFVPLWDKSYDTYESYIERTPFSTNGLLAVAAKIRAGNGILGETFHRCLEEAQGIARSTLFGPIVRKEAVMAMLILSVWSQNGWLPCGHALRGGLDMNLHRALDKLVGDQVQPRNEAEERDLVVSARIWLNCYMHDHLVSLGTGKPLLLRDDSSVRHARLLLTHPMGSETDMRLIAGVELVSLRVRVVDHLSPLHGKMDSQTISFVRRMFADLQAWHREWHAIHRQRLDEEHVLVKLLEAELVYAQLWTVCVALRGCQWDKLPADQRELAFQAKDAALRCLEIFLRSENFRSHLKYATHDQLVSVAFAAVFLLKIAILYPNSCHLPTVVSQVSELTHLLSNECFAERYALTLRLMLSNFRKKTGVLSTMPGTPRYTGGTGTGDTLPVNPSGTNGALGELDGGLQSLLSLPQMDFGDSSGMADWGMEGMENFSWPTEFSPSNLPVWLQDGNFTDLGLPVDGSDSLFLPPELANMFMPSTQTNNSSFQFSLPDSADVGAEAW